MSNTLSYTLRKYGDNEDDLFPQINDGPLIIQKTTLHQTFKALECIKQDKSQPQQQQLNIQQQQLQPQEQVLQHDESKPNNGLALQRIRDFLLETNNSNESGTPREEYFHKNTKQIEKHIFKQQFLEKNKLFDPTQYFGGLNIIDLGDGINDKRLDDMFLEYIPTEQEQEQDDEGDPNQIGPIENTIHNDVSNSMTVFTSDKEKQYSNPLKSRNNLLMKSKHDQISTSHAFLMNHGVPGIANKTTTTITTTAATINSFSKNPHQSNNHGEAVAKTLNGLIKPKPITNYNNANSNNNSSKVKVPNITLDSNNEKKKKKKEDNKSKYNKLTTDGSILYESNVWSDDIYNPYSHSNKENKSILSNINIPKSIHKNTSKSRLRDTCRSQNKTDRSYLITAPTDESTSIRGEKSIVNGKRSKIPYTEILTSKSNDKCQLSTTITTTNSNSNKVCNSYRKQTPPPSSLVLLPSTGGVIKHKGNAMTVDSHLYSKTHVKTNSEYTGGLRGRNDLSSFINHSEDVIIDKDISRRNVQKCQCKRDCCCYCSSSSFLVMNTSPSLRYITNTNYNKSILSIDNTTNENESKIIIAHDNDHFHQNKDENHFTGHSKPHYYTSFATKSKVNNHHVSLNKHLKILKPLSVGDQRIISINTKKSQDLNKVPINSNNNNRIRTKGDKCLGDLLVYNSNNSLPKNIVSQCEAINNSFITPNVIMHQNNSNNNNNNNNTSLSNPNNTINLGNLNNNPNTNRKYARKLFPLSKFN